VVAPVDPKRGRPEVYSNDIADAMEAYLQPLATSGLVTGISKYDIIPPTVLSRRTAPERGIPSAK
jgi:hypothetical protein